MIDDRNETKRGMVWLGSATALSRLLDVGASLVVFALLSREELGTAALALGAGAVVEAFCGMGLGYALVQAQGLTRDCEQSLFWLSSGIGVLQAALLVVAAPLIAGAYDAPVLLPMVAVTGAKVLLIGVSVVPHQLLNKHLRFREAGLAQTLCSVAEGLAKIGFAVAGLGAWALVLANVVRGLVMLSAVLALSGFRPQRHFAWAEAKQPLSFGARVAGSSVLYQSYRNADYFLIGRLLGVEAVGVYRVAFELGMQPLEIVLGLVNRVAYPIYAKVAHDTRALKRALLRSTRSLTLLVAPIVAFVFFAAEDLLALITHSRWLAAAPAAQILVLGSLLRGAAHLFPQIYVAAGRPGFATLDAMASLLVLVGLFWSGLTWLPEWGTLSVCWAWLVAYPVLLPLHLALTRRILPLASGEYLRALAPGVAGAGVMFLGMLATRPLGLQEWGSLPHLLVSVLVGLATYAVYLRVALGIRLRDLAPKAQVASAP